MGRESQAVVLSTSSMESLICDQPAQFIAQRWKDNCCSLGGEETQSAQICDLSFVTVPQEVLQAGEKGN